MSAIAGIASSLCVSFVYKHGGEGGDFLANSAIMMYRKSVLSSSTYVGLGSAIFGDCEANMKG